MHNKNAYTNLNLEYYYGIGFIINIKKYNKKYCQYNKRVLLVDTLFITKILSSIVI